VGNFWRESACALVLIAYADAEQCPCYDARLPPYLREVLERRWPNGAIEVAPAGTCNVLAFVKRAPESGIEANRVSAMQIVGGGDGLAQRDAVRLNFPPIVGPLGVAR